MRVKIIMFTVILLLLSGCAVDPRNVADAENSKKLTNEAVADQQAARAQAQADWDLAHGERAAISAAWVNSWSAAVPWIWFFGSFSVMVVVFSAAYSISLATIGLGQAVATSAAIRARLVYLDRSTGQYPAYLPGAADVYMDINNGLVLPMTPTGPEPLLAAAANNTRALGVVANNARLANDGQGGQIAQGLAAADIRYPIFDEVEQ